MIILGITNNDLAGACLVRDGTIVAAASEERFTRQKDHKAWPSRSIDYVLGEAGIDLADIDRIAYGWNAGFDAGRHLDLYLDRVLEEARERPEGLPHLRKRIADEMANDKAKRGEFDAFVRANGLRGKVEYIDHHECHALGAFVCSPFDEALTLTCDGRGDFQSLTVTTTAPTAARRSCNARPASTAWATSTGASPACSASSRTATKARSPAWRRSATRKSCCR